MRKSTDIQHPGPTGGRADWTGHGATESLEKRRSFPRIRAFFEPEDRALVVVCVVYALLLLWSHRNSAIAFLGDFKDYLDTSKLSLLSLQFYARRPFTVPLVYKFLAQNPAEIVSAQLAVHAVCWLLLAVAVWRSIKSRVVQWLAVVAILGLSLTVQINIWNFSILSESIADSLTALLVALILFTLNPRPPFGTDSAQGVRLNKRQLSLLFVTAFFWSFSRDANPYGLLAASAILLVLLAVGRMRRMVRPRLILCMVIFLAGTFGLQSCLLSRSVRHPWTAALSDVICTRILPVPEFRRYFAQKGMPADGPIMQFAGETNEYMQNQFSPEPDPSKIDKPFDEWVGSHGVATYMSFISSHPLTVLGWVWDLRGQLISPRLRRSWMPPATVVFQLHWGKRIPMYWMWPRGTINGETGLTIWLSNLLFPAWQGFWWIALLLGAASVSTFFLARRSYVAWVPIALIIIGFSQALLVALGDSAEVDRHAIGAAVLVHIGALLGLLVVLDAAVSWLSPGPVGFLSPGGLRKRITLTGIVHRLEKWRHE
jgi:hypothetical protein